MKLYERMLRIYFEEPLMTGRQYVTDWLLEDEAIVLLRTKFKDIDETEHGQGYCEGYYRTYHCEEKYVEQEPCDKCVYSTKDGCCQYDDIAETIPPLEPCEDAISRQAVINILQDYVFEEDEIESATDECQNNMAESIARNIVQLQPVNPQPKTGWVPVSVRLPKEDESVLLTICANSSLYGFNKNFVKVMCGRYSPCEDKRDWIVNEIRYYIDNVIAWRPLPEPYDPQERSE